MMVIWNNSDLVMAKRLGARLLKYPFGQAPKLRCLAAVRNTGNATRTVSQVERLFSEIGL